MTQYQRYYFRSFNYLAFIIIIIIIIIIISSSSSSIIVTVIIIIIEWGLKFQSEKF